MRVELSGSLVIPAPLVVRYVANDNLINMSQYVTLGYTHFDIICIGAGGGMGGGINPGGSGNRSYGGAGGGGGYCRVRGLLSQLPPIGEVVVGVGGTLGSDHASDPALTTNGGDGGFSSFNDTTCVASGGKGGKRVQSNSLTVTTQADGGDGGIGDRSIAGGGGTGGVAGTPAADSSGGIPGTPGQDGTLFGDIGRGGGGGAGGIGTYDGIAHNAATAGGRGSYNPGDTSVYGPGDTPNTDSATGALIIPGGASGAKAAPLNGLPTVYGQSRGEPLPGNPGIVIIRFTAE